MDARALEYFADGPEIDARRDLHLTWSTEDWGWDIPSFQPGVNTVLSCFPYADSHAPRGRVRLEGTQFSFAARCRSGCGFGRRGTWRTFSSSCRSSGVICDVELCKYFLWLHHGESRFRMADSHSCGWYQRIGQCADGNHNFSERADTNGAGVRVFSEQDIREPRDERIGSNRHHYRHLQFAHTGKWLGFHGR